MSFVPSPSACSMPEMSVPIVVGAHVASNVRQSTEPAWALAGPAAHHAGEYDGAHDVQDDEGNDQDTDGGQVNASNCPGNTVKTGQQSTQLIF